LADGDQREARCELPDEFHLASGKNCVEQLVGGREDRVMERRDSPGCELLARETAQPGVIRRIKEHEASGQPVIPGPRLEAEHPGEPVAECAEPPVGGNNFEVVGS
jgi:hypothetical protein